MNFGLALGGGGAKGLAHIGVLEVLEEHRLNPTCVAGTSIGSIVGALYCLSGSAKNLRETAHTMIQSEEFKNLGLDKFYTETENVFERFKREVFEKFYLGALLFKKSDSKIEAARKLYRDLFGDKKFKDCKIRFTCNALDIQSGDEIIFKSGSIAEAVWASCAIPGIFPPFVKKDRIFVDGGVVDNIPITPVKEIGAKTVLAVYLGHRPQFHGEPNTGFRINQRSLSFMKYYFDQHILALADVVINPDVSAFHWADFSALDELVIQGRKTTTTHIKKVKSILSPWYSIKKMLRSRV
jgi:NTE family protein